MFNRTSKALVALLVAGLVGTAAYAAIIVDDQGVGFVGKGDVQSLFGWNNKALQDCVASTTHAGYDAETDAGCLRFSFAVEAVTERTNTWLCGHDTNPNAADQEQNNEVVVTLSAGGVVASVARARNQVNGFNLNGGEWTITEEETADGPPTNHCQAANRSYKEGSTETTETDLGSVRKLKITDVRTGESYEIDLDEDADDEDELV